MKRKQIMRTLLATLAVICVGILPKDSQIDKALSKIGIECQQEASADTTVTDSQGIIYDISGLTATVTGVSDRNIYKSAIKIPESIDGKEVTTIKIASFHYAKIGYLSLPKTITTVEDYAFNSPEINTLEIKGHTDGFSKLAFAYKSVSNIIVRTEDDFRRLRFQDNNHEFRYMTCNYSINNKTDNPKVVVNKTVASNREDGVTLTVTEMLKNVEYYYTTDGTTPSKTNGILVYDSIIKLNTVNSDGRTDMQIKVVGIEEGLSESEIVQVNLTYEGVKFKESDIIYEVNSDNLSVTILDFTILTKSAIPKSVNYKGKNYLVNKVNSSAICSSTNIESLDCSLSDISSKILNNDIRKLNSIKLSIQELTSCILPTGWFKVYLMDSDEATPLGAYLVKQGTNLSQYLDTPVSYGKTFDKWTKASVASNSVIGNIQDNVTFVAFYTDGVLKLPKPTLIVSADIAMNRDDTVKVKLTDMEPGLKYMYTLDDSNPTANKGLLVDGDTISIPKQDIDNEKVVTIKVVSTIKGTCSKVSEVQVKFLAGTVSNDPTYVEDGITYSMHSNNTATVKSATGKTENVVIPYSVNGSKVIEIGQSAFANCVDMTSVTIPNTVNWIAPYAFKGCTGMTDVAIPQTITSLNGGTFSGCSSLSNLKLPDSVISITEFDFEGCNKLSTIKVNPSVLNIQSVSGYNKVYFMDNDEETILGGWLARTGVSMSGRESIPVKKDNTFSKWTRYTPVSSSMLSNIVDNVTFMADYNSTPGTPGEGQLKKPTLTPSKSQAKNRETGVTVKAK